MKRVLAVLFATMLAGQVWASNYNEWFASGGAAYGAFTTENNIAKIVVSKGAANADPWTIQFCNILRGNNGQQEGRKFKLMLEIKYEGSLGEGASFSLLTGKLNDSNGNVLHDDYQWGNNTEVVGRWFNTPFAVGKEWTTIIVAGTIGEKGAEYVGLQLNFGGNAANEGTFLIRNVIIEMGNYTLAYFNDINPVTIDDFKYLINNNEAILLGLASPINVATIPKSIEYEGKTYPITIITQYSFSDCKELTSITIPSSITSIGDNAFSGCTGLTSVSIPNSVTSIGVYAFSGCTGLSSITIPESVTSIGGAAFSGCTGLTSVTIPNSVTNISNNAFDGCDNIETLTYNTNAIGSLFRGKTSLKTVNIGNSVTSIGEYAFYGCSGLTSVTIPNSVTKINYKAFDGCDNIETLTYNTNAIGSLFKGKISLKTVNIGDSVTSIVNEAFNSCSGITSVTIPNSVTSIGWNAFQGCSKLTSVTIGNSVTSIGAYAFSGCSSLETVNFNAQNCSSMGDGTYPIFSGCTSLKTINIGDNVEKIPSNAFSRCSGLTSITIPESVTSIGNYAFSGCSSMTSITIPESVTSIGNYAFSGCSSMTSIMIPNSVTRIEDYSFYNCDGLTSVFIPNTMTSIGNYAFSECPNITQISIPNSVTSIGNYAFNGCYGLTTVSIPNSVTKIGNSAFKDCINLTIYCQAKIKHSGWNNDWNISGCPVEWGANLKSVTVIADNNEHGSVYGSGVYIDGLAITITAAPATGYHFVSWSDGNTENPRTINVGDDITITAKFEASSYTVTINAENGTVTGHTGTFAYGAEVTLIAEPAAGYRFVSWSDGNTDNPRTITIKEDMVLTAVFDVGENHEGNSTAVNETTANTVNIFAYGNTIVVENATDEIFIYNAMGKLICRNCVHAKITVNGPGVYIVKTGNAVKRVMVN